MIELILVSGLSASLDTWNELSRVPSMSVWLTVFRRQLRVSFPFTNQRKPRHFKQGQIRPLSLNAPSSTSDRNVSSYTFTGYHRIAVSSFLFINTTVFFIIIIKSRKKGNFRRHPRCYHLLGNAQGKMPVQYHVHLSTSHSGASFAVDTGFKIAVPVLGPISRILFPLEFG